MTMHLQTLTGASHKAHRRFYPCGSNSVHRYAMLTLVVASQFALADEYAEARKVFEDAGESGAFFNHSYGYALFRVSAKAVSGWRRLW